MRKMTVRKFIAVVAGAMVGLISFDAETVAAVKFKKLTGEQIRAKFSGMELTDEIHWVEYYEVNGKVTAVELNQMKAGKWWIQNHQLCTDYGKDGGRNCYDVWLSGNSVELRNALNYSPVEGILRRPEKRR
jgi:hypothetical protein